MPTTELEVVDARRHRLRHIKPYVEGEGTTSSSQELFRRLYSFRELPISSMPEARDYSDASWTGRLGDAGEMEITFPNKEASDGQPWRDRFSTAGHLEFLEIYRDDVLEHVDVILKVVPDQQSVLISGQDGWFLLRNAYERNWVCVQAPRDVIERASYVWAMQLGDEFTELNPTRWSKEEFGEGEATTHIGVVTGGLRMFAQSKGSPSGARAAINSKGLTLSSTSRWRLIVTFTVIHTEASHGYILDLKSTTGSIGYYLGIYPVASLFTGGAFAEGVAELQVPTALGSHSFQITLPNGFHNGPHTLQMESDGRYLRAYVDGYFVGETLTIGGELEAQFRVFTGSGPGLNEVILQEFLLRKAEPFLMRGSEKGDYVLPGGVETYPYGGLTGRYYNDLDLQELPEYYRVVFAQERTLNKQIQYQDRTDSTIVNPEPPFPGASTVFWSCRWFGSVYLDLEHNAEIEFIISNLDDGCRLWIGKTQFGSQVIDEWSKGAAREVKGKVKASELGAKKGWFPIILEYFQAAGAHGIELKFKPVTTGWTDPGGTVLTTAVVVIPATSLSPLGCVDQHYQGQSHFNITKETAEAFGYQMQCEPRQLESGEFPGQLVPKARVGRDTDEILTSDSIGSRSPVVNYKNTIDATDQATSLFGTGAGLPNGQNGQISAEEFSLSALEESLFDLQGWIDAADINSPSLLSARVASQLDNQTEPWQNVEGEPLARDRLADTFPITGKLSAFRWRPGDGIRISLPDVNIRDTIPRQILQVTRQFGPIGRHGTQMGFRQRPLDRVSQVNHAIRRALQPQRNYQKQIVTLPCTQIREEIAAGAEGGAWSVIPVQASDIIIRAMLLIVTNTTEQPLHVVINNNDMTTFLGGPWSVVPTNILLSSLTPENAAGGGRKAAYIRIKNTGASNTFVEAIPLVEVLR